MNVLSCKQLSIGYRKGNHISTIQSNLNLDVHEGELICLIGPNGCGKSTLLRTLADLQKPLSGKVLIEDKNIALLSVSQKALLFSFVLTERIDIENLRVYDLVSMGRLPHTGWLSRLTEKDEKAVQEAIEMVHLSHKKEAFVNELSDGEKQRAMIAKALAQETPLILLDEPTAHLDLPNRVQIMLLLRRLAKDTGKAIVLSTHELDLALQAADFIWLMDKKGVTTGLPEDLVLQGTFQQAFANENVDFHSETGSFSMHYPTTKAVHLTGDTTQVYWTKRTLARAGYAVLETADIHISANNNHWKINQTSVNTLQELLSTLREC